MDSTYRERLHEPYATRECVLNQNFGTVRWSQVNQCIKKNCNLQMELNKSYDAKNPSPLLMQNQNTDSRWMPLQCPVEKSNFGKQFEKVNGDLI